MWNIGGRSTRMFAFIDQHFATFPSQNRSIPSRTTSQPMSSTPCKETAIYVRRPFALISSRAWPVHSLIAFRLREPCCRPFPFAH